MKIFFRFYILFIFFSPLFGGLILRNDEILSQRVQDKILLLGSELFNKTNIPVYLTIIDKLETKNLYEFYENLNLKAPFALLFLSKDDRKVDIYSDENTSKLFNKEQILSPFPERGTILPILTSNKGKDIYNAAILNGYADLTEQIAKSKNIILDNALGNSNKIFINLLRYFIYGSIFFVLFLSFYKRKKSV